VRPMAPFSFQARGKEARPVRRHNVTSVRAGATRVTLSRSERHKCHTGDPSGSECDVEPVAWAPFSFIAAVRAPGPC
jgi:hypothetical protein